MQELTFVIGPDRAVAEIWEILGSVDLAMVASATYPSTEGRNVRIVIENGDAETARRELLAQGFGAIDTREVLVADIEPGPGELGRLARRIADSGAVLNTLYMATEDRVVIGADNLDEVAGGL